MTVSLLHDTPNLRPAVHHLRGRGRTASRPPVSSGVAAPLVATYRLSDAVQCGQAAQSGAARRRVRRRAIARGGLNRSGR